MYVIYVWVFINNNTSTVYVLRRSNLLENHREKNAADHHCQCGEGLNVTSQEELVQPG